LDATPFPFQKTLIAETQHATTSFSIPRLSPPFASGQKKGRHTAAFIAALSHLAIALT